MGDDHATSGPEPHLDETAAPDPVEPIALGALSGRGLLAIEGYEVLRRMRSGGMGTVYEARQSDTGQRVAIKVIRAGAMSETLLRRFELEAKALGRLDHPGIARILEADTHGRGEDRVPYFAMEFVDGPYLLQHAHNLSVPERVELLARVCDAVHHAHQRRIIHRDLKPSNILLLTQGDGVEPPGQPKVLDFGVARATDGDLLTCAPHTAAGQLLGTVQYMSPEQVTARADDIDVRSDVYSLGVIGYLLLSGRLPYDVSDRPITEAAGLICAVDPPRLGTIDRAFRGDLETIIGTALAKERERRYQSAHEFAADLRRHLDDQPISARPPTPLYRLGKFARRHRVLVRTAAAVLITLVAGLVATSVALVRATLAEREASQTLEVLERMLEAVQPASTLGADTTLMRQMLDATADRLDRGLVPAGKVAARVRSTVGVTYLFLGEYEKADRHLRQTLEWQTAALGPEHPQTLTSRFFLAQLRQKQGDLDEALTHARTAVEGQRAALGDDDPDTLRSLSVLAGIHHDRDELAEAAPLLAETLERQIAVLGESDLDTLRTMTDLAVLQSQMGRFPEAEALHKRALDLKRRTLPGNHPDILVSLSNIAAFYLEQARVDDAAPLLREVLERESAVLGRDHPQVGATIGNAGVAFMFQCRLDEAEEVFERLLEAQLALGAEEEHPDALKTRNNLAAIAVMRGRLAEAEQVFAGVLESQARTLGPEHIQTLQTRNNLAEVYVRQGRFAEAEPLLQAGVQALRRSVGDDHEDTIAALAALADCYSRWGRTEQAEPLHRVVIEAARSALPDGHPVRTVCLLGHGAHLARTGNFEDAERMILDAHDALAATFCAEFYLVRDAVASCVDLYERWGKGEEVARWRAKLDPSASAAGPAAEP